MEVVTPGVLQCPCEDSGFPMRLDTLLLVCRIAPQLPTLLLLCGTHILGLKTQIFVFLATPAMLGAGGGPSRTLCLPYGVEGEGSPSAQHCKPQRAAVPKTFWGRPSPPHCHPLALT